MGNEDAALDSLSRGAALLASQSAEAMGRALKLKFVERPAYRRWSVVSLVIGVVAGGASAGLLVAANQNHLTLINGTPQTEMAGRSAQFAGQLEQTLGMVCIGLAGAALVTAGVLLLVDLLTAPAAPVRGNTGPVVTWAWP